MSPLICCMLRTSHARGDMWRKGIQPSRAAQADGSASQEEQKNALGCLPGSKLLASFVRALLIMADTDSCSEVNSQQCEEGPRASPPTQMDSDFRHPSGAAASAAGYAGINARGLPSPFGFPTDTRSGNAAAPCISSILQVDSNSREQPLRENPAFYGPQRSMIRGRPSPLTVETTVETPAHGHPRRSSALPVMPRAWSTMALSVPYCAPQLRATRLLRNFGFASSCLEILANLGMPTVVLCRWACRFV